MHYDQNDSQLFGRKAAMYYLALDFIDLIAIRTIP